MVEFGGVSTNRVLCTRRSEYFILNCGECSEHMSTFRNLTNAFAFVACSCAATFLTASAARGAGITPVSIELNVADVMRQVGDGLSYLLSRHDERQQQLVRQSLPQIQIGLSELAAGKESVIAALRESLAASSSVEDRKNNLVHISGTNQQRVRDGYAAIRNSLRGLNADLRKLDPLVGAKDTKLTEALFSRFMSQGSLTNELGQLMNVKLEPGENDAVSDRDKIAAFVRRFNTVRDIERLNERISAMRGDRS